MCSEILLVVWSMSGLIWWLLAWRLVSTPQKNEETLQQGTPKSLSIFKPLPPSRAQGLSAEAAGLESFISQLGDDMELLLGIHEVDRQASEPFVERMRNTYPRAQIKVIYRTQPDEVANPKIAWQKILAPHATGDLWLWSDAEIVAPTGFLQSARAEYEQCGATMLTFPYVIREIKSPRAMLDGLFVNADFYPGVLLLREKGPVDFGLGSAMLFARSDFESLANWGELGSVLADDFVLGQQLKSVQIGHVTLMTSIDAPTWKEAILHHLRWSKTIWWNRPLGSASRIVILPGLGWLLYLLLYPASPLGWIGFISLIQVDVIFAALICRQLDCPLRARDLLAMELWSLSRILVWIACWFPWPVSWRGQWWRGPQWT